MRWGLAAVLCLLAGCSISGAIEIVIDNPHGDGTFAVDRVQLYVGLGHQQNDAPEILVPSGYGYPDASPKGIYWRRDVNGGNDIQDVASGANDVRFVFQPGTHDKITVVVVGTQGGAVTAAASLVDAYFDDGAVRQYHVKLLPATDAFPRQVAQSRTVQRWGPTQDDAHCVHLVDPANAADPSIYVVDKDDRDCDGFVVDDEDPSKNLECREDVWNGHVRAAPQNAQCLRFDTVYGATATPAQACVLGGAGCLDGQGVGKCEPSNVCATPDQCVRCGADSNPIDCMMTFSAANVTIPRIECTFFATGAEICPGDAVLTTRFPFAMACDTTLPFLFWQDNRTWQPKTFTRSSMTFGALNPAPDCAMKLSYLSGPIQNPTPRLTSVVSATLVNGRGLALPIAVSLAFVADCGAVNNTCQFVGDATPGDNLPKCIVSKIVEPW